MSPTLTIAKRELRANFDSAALYVVGAVGLEMAGGWWTEGHGSGSALAVLLVALEESFEMAGIVVALAALLAHGADALAGTRGGASWPAWN